MIVVTPNFERVGPCSVVVALPVGKSLLGRLDLLEEVAALARAVLEEPGDTDAAGRLAGLLGVAGYPLREEALALTTCVDYTRHELFCAHQGKETRWVAADGCSGLACGACLGVVRGWPSDDKVQEIPVDADGIPFSRADWTSADYLGHMIRTTEREPAS